MNISWQNHHGEENGCLTQTFWCLYNEDMMRELGADSLRISSGSENRSIVLILCLLSIYNYSGVLPSFGVFTVG